MSVKDEIKISFPASSENECFARTAVSAFISRLDPHIDELADIRTAVSEAVTCIQREEWYGLHYC